MGFFFIDKPVGPRRPAGSTDVSVPRSSKHRALLTSTPLACNNCPLDNAPLAHPKMVPTGAENPLVYIMGEAPGKEEDEEGVQFIGKAGETLRSKITEERLTKIRWANVIRCRPTATGANREPSQLEIACCRRLQEADIASSKPAAVFGFGNVPLAWMIGEPGIHQWRGRRIPCRIRGHTFWYYPMLHPSYINRIRNDKKKGVEWEEVFTWDLERAFLEVETGKEEPYVEDAKKDFLAGITPILTWKLEDVHRAFLEIQALPDIGLDIETNGLRPHAKGAKILSMAFGTYEKVYAIPIAHRQSKWTPDQHRELNEMIHSFLIRSGKKWCHKTQFEQEWLSFFYGDDILFETLWGDTLAQAYVLDEREGKALGDMTLINLGFDLKKYSSVNVAKLDDEPLEDVLLYNGPDAKYCHAIALIQQEKIETAGLTAVYDMTARRCATLVLTQKRGLHVNPAEVQGWNTQLTKQIGNTLKKILALPAIEEWQKVEGREFNPTSPHDLINLMRDHLKIPEVRKGDGSYTTDESVLEQIRHPIAQLILALRADTTLLTRYVTPYLPGGKHIAPDGLVYGEFNHLVTRTGRLASNDPNLQNWPKRKSKDIRNIICAPPGEWIVSCDYGQIEARVLGMASQDHKFCSQLWTSFDIHAYWAEKLFKACPRWEDYLIEEFKLDPKDKKALFKTGRNEVKNNFVFAQFYGSHYEGCAAMLNIPSNVGRRLSEEFWADYTGVRLWQERGHEFYHEHGYVETLTGRRRHAPLSANERVNSPIQGTASDIVVDAMERLAVIAYEQGRPQLQPILNVHDDLTFRLPDKTLEEDVADIVREMIFCRYNFINVPIVVEVSAGKAWGSLEELQVYRSTDYPDWIELFGAQKPTHENRTKN